MEVPQALQAVGVTKQQRRYQQHRVHATGLVGASNVFFSISACSCNGPLAYRQNYSRERLFQN